MRDQLLGIPSQDRDWVVVGESPQTLLNLGYQQVGADFPVFLHPLTSEEYALARTERKTGPGYRGFSVLSGPEVTLEEDLIRRDLTINAMALDCQGRLIDPFGGEADLNSRTLRHVSSAFAEDPLRVVRVARFMARFAPLGFTIAPETQTLMGQLANSGALQELTPERVWMETHKALLSPSPSLFFKTLHHTHALQEIFPELAALVGQEQVAKYHPEGDAWEHTLLSLEAATQLSDKPEIRLAALLHDLGKGLTPAEQLPHHCGHEAYGAREVASLCQRLKIPKSFKKLATMTARHHLHCHRLQEMRPNRIVKLLNQLDGFRNPQGIDAFVLACTADKWGRGAKSRHTPYREGELLKRCLAACQKIDNSLFSAAGLQGKAFGEALHHARVKTVNSINKRSLSTQPEDK